MEKNDSKSNKRRRPIVDHPIKIKIEPETVEKNLLDQIYHDEENKPIIKLEKFAYKQEKKLSKLNFKQTNIQQVVDSHDLRRNEENISESYEKIKKVKWEPPQWREQYEKIKAMRTDLTAPVDTMGCDAISSIDENISDKEKRYQVLVSLMLSAQTKDEVTAKAMSELQKMPLTVNNFLNTSDEILEKNIYPVSFYKRKVQFIKKTSQILMDKYDSDIPDNVNDLMKLPGVGPKMAYITMSCAWNSTVGIGVDTHVHRIANRLGWTRTETKLPENTRKELEEWLPPSYWTEVNPMLVGFGQQTCRPIGPKCGTCLCRELCPVGKKFVEKKPKIKNAQKSKKKSNIKSSEASQKNPI